MGPLCIPIRGQLVNPVAVDSKTHSAGAAQKSGEAPQFSIVEQLKSSWWRAPERTRVFVGVPKLLLCTAGARAAAGGGGGASSSARSTITLGRPSFPRFVLRTTQHSIAAPTSHYKLCCGCSSLFFYLDSSLDAAPRCASVAAAAAVMVLVLAYRSRQSLSPTRTVNC